MLRRVMLLVAAASATAMPAMAQRRLQLDPAHLRAEARPPSAEVAPPAALREARSRAGTSRTLLHTLGGALIGAGAGFLASEVVWSDWDRSSGSEFNSRRTAFTLAGGAVGSVAGLLLGRSHGPHTDRVVTEEEVRARHPANWITEEEVRASTALNVYELVHAMRPAWLRGHGPTDLHGSDNAVRVYLDKSLLGDVGTLRVMALADVGSLEFLDEAAATYRLGAGNISGAIVVHPGTAR